MNTILVASVVVVCLGLSTLLGLAAAWGRQHVSEDYFLAGKSLPWWVVGLSIAGTACRLEIWLALIGLTYTVGLAAGTLLWSNFLAFSLLVGLLLPFYIRKRLSGPAEFFERRYSPAIRAIFVLLAMLFMIVGVLAPSLFLGGWFLCETGLGIPVDGLSWQLAACVAAIAVVTALYCVYGGLSAGAWSSALQMLIVIAGGTLLAVAATRQAGGLPGLVEKNAWPRLDLLLSSRHATFPWTGVLAVWLTLSIWNTATNPAVVQRCLGAQSEWDARMGVLVAALLQIPLAAVILLPGLSGLAKVSSFTVTGLTIDRGALGMIETLFGRETVWGSLGLGLVISAVLAAVMSTVSAAATAFAGLWTMDVCQDLFRRNASEIELVGRGRRSTFMALLLGAALAPLLVLWDKGLVVFVLEVAAVVGPPVAVIALVAFFWSRAHGRAALMALVVGVLAGAGLWFVAAFGEMVPEWMMPVLNRAGLSGAVSFVLLVLSTFIIPQDPDELYDPDTRWSFRGIRLPGHERELGAGPRSLLFWWLVLALLTAAVWVVFR